jgi:hypothetical protein
MKNIMYEVRMPSQLHYARVYHCHCHQLRPYNAYVFKCASKVEKSDYQLRDVCLSVLMEQLRSNLADFHGI